MTSLNTTGPQQGFPETPVSDVSPESDFWSAPDTTPDPSATGLTRESILEVLNRPMAQYFMITGLLALVALVLLVIYCVISCIEERRAMAEDRKDNGHAHHLPASTSTFTDRRASRVARHGNIVRAGTTKVRLAFPLGVQGTQR